MQIYDFNNVVESERKYGGMAGAKLGIIFNGEHWILKFPKSTRAFKTQEIAYTTSPLSEYLGSHIYESVGIPVHQTLLGIKDNKLVVACKDFKESGEELYEFDEIKNDYVKELEDKLEHLASFNERGIDLSEIMLIMAYNPTFLRLPLLREHFWDMFVVDAFIGNNDRNNGNWGILVNEATSTARIAPVYDNGASFSNKMSEERMQIILEDKHKFEQTAYISRISAFYENNKNINPYRYMAKISNPDLNDAILRVIPRIDVDKIKDIIYSLPSEYSGINVASDTVKKFYYQLLEYRYSQVLLPIHEKVKQLKKSSIVQNLDERVL